MVAAIVPSCLQKYWLSKADRGAKPFALQLYSKTTESSVDKGALDGTLPAALLSASQKSREKSEMGLRSAGSGVFGAGSDRRLASSENDV